jgi:hemerythrin-like domain-containing protein
MKASGILVDAHRVTTRVLGVLEATDFITDFTDGSQYHKEEGALLEAMAAAGVPRDAEAVSRVAAAARGYANLLCQHIVKEDQILLPMAEQAIPRGEHDSVIEALDRVEPEDVRASVHAKYTALAEVLEREIAE